MELYDAIANYYTWLEIKDFAIKVIGAWVVIHYIVLSNKTCK